MESAVSFKGNICVSASMKMLEVTEAPRERCGEMWQYVVEQVWWVCW